MVIPEASVANVATQVVDQLTHFPPDSVAHPGIATVAVAGGIVGAFIEDKLSKRNEERFAAPFQNPEALEEALQAVRGTTSRRRHMAPALGATIGMGLSAAGLLGGFGYDTNKANQNSRLVVVNDASYTMRLTHDVGGTNKSRYETAVEGEINSSYIGQIAVLETGRSYRLSLPMGPRKRQDLSTLVHPKINPNGGDLAPAIDEAISLLPRKKGSDKDTKVGTVLVVSDGSVSSSTTQMANAAKRAEKSGVDLKAVVPGSANGVYSINGSDPIKSAVNTDTFSSLESKNVVTANTDKEVKEAVAKVMQQAGSNRERTNWYGLLGLGLGVFAVSGAALAVQRVKKIA